MGKGAHTGRRQDTGVGNRGRGGAEGGGGMAQAARQRGDHTRRGHQSFSLTTGLGGLLGAEIETRSSLNCTHGGRGARSMAGRDTGA